MSINLDNLNGKVITIESTRFMDWFIDTRDKAMDEACLSPLPMSKRQGPYTDPGAPKPSQWQLWKVHVRDNGRVSFESTERPDHYLDLNHRLGWGGMHAISVTWCTSLRAVGNWGQFKIHGTMDDATIQCMRWEDRWLVAHSMKRVMGGKYGSAPPTDSYDGWGHWTIKDVFAKPAADEAAAQGNVRTIVHKEWKDSYQDLMEGSVASETIGMDVGTGSDTTIGNETTVGLAVMVGFAAVATGEVTVNVENTTSVSKTNSVSLNRMKESTKTLTGPGPGTKKYTAWWLTVTFSDGEYMKVMGRLVPTDRSGGTFKDEFNPAKVPKMMSDKAVLGAIASAFQ